MAIYQAYSRILSKNANKLLVGFKQSSSTMRINLIRGLHRFNPAPKCDKTVKWTQSLQWVLAGGVVVSAKIAFDSNIAKCEAKIQPPLLLSTNTSVQEVKDGTALPWSQLCQYILPHILSLVVAVSAALMVAIVNTKIGIAIGSLVNVVSSNIHQSREIIEDTTSSFMQQIRSPAINLIKLYLLHATCTFSYIYSLAIVGEF